MFVVVVVAVAHMRQETDRLVPEHQGLASAIVVLRAFPLPLSLACRTANVVMDTLDKISILPDQGKDTDHNQNGCEGLEKAFIIGRTPPAIVLRRFLVVGSKNIHDLS